MIGIEFLNDWNRVPGSFNGSITRGLWGLVIRACIFTLGPLGFLAGGSYTISK